MLVLDASGNSMREEELGTVLHLYGLETLHLANNDIKDIPQVRWISTVRLSASGHHTISLWCTVVSWLYNFPLVIPVDILFFEGP